MKVLLVRADGVGDALACTPLVAALRAAGHTLGAVLSTRNRAAFAARTFERVHVLERIPWPRHGSTSSSRCTALDEARAERYDVALVASEELEAYELARDSRIARRVGFINGWEKPLKTLRVRPLLTRALVRAASARRAREHEAQTLFGLGSMLHGECEPSRDPARLRLLLLDGEPSSTGRVALQTSTKFASLGLDAPAFADIARSLAERFALDVLGDDPVLVERVAAASGARALRDLDMQRWKEAIVASRALVTPDSGAAHVAGFTGTPCVDLFPAHATTVADVLRWRPWASPSRVRVFAADTRTPAFARAVADDVTALAG